MTEKAVEKASLRAALGVVRPEVVADDTAVVGKEVGWREAEERKAERMEVAPMVAVKEVSTGEGEMVGERSRGGGREGKLEVW